MGLALDMAACARERVLNVGRVARKRSVRNAFFAASVCRASFSIRLKDCCPEEGRDEVNGHEVESSARCERPNARTLLPLPHESALTTCSFLGAQVGNLLRIQTQRPFTFADNQSTTFLIFR